MKLLFITFMLFTLSMSIKAQQVHNRLPRKAIIGAMHNAMQDSTGATLKPFECRRNTTSITIEVTNLSLPEERPYIITVDSLGVTLEIFRGDEHVFNEFFHYHGSNFNRIKAKVKSAKLKKVKSHGESLEGGNTTVLNFNNRKGTYFRLSDKSGIMDYEGDFDGVITEITRQIPNFQAIICKDYGLATSTEIKDEILLNNQICTMIKPTEVSGVLTFGEVKECNIITLTKENPGFSISFLEDKHELKLIKMRKFRGKKKKKEFYGITFENVVKNTFAPESKSSLAGVTTIKYILSDLSDSFYVLYDSRTNEGYIFRVIFENAVG